MEQTVSQHTIATQNHIDLSFSHHSQCVTLKSSTKQKVRSSFHSKNGPFLIEIDSNNHPKIIKILDYIYHNSIYWHAPGSNEPREVFAWKCTYEDKYSVSLDFAIKPVERTLQFVTEKGKFDVQMKVYEDETFAPQYEVNS